MELKIDHSAPISLRTKIVNVIFWFLLVAQVVLFENEKIRPPSYWLGKTLGFVPTLFEKLGNTIYALCMHIYINYINIKYLARAFSALVEPVIQFMIAPIYFFKGLVWDNLSSTSVYAISICAGIGLFMLVVVEYNAKANHKPSYVLTHAKFFVDWFYGWASIICVDILQFSRVIGFDTFYETLVALLNPLGDIIIAPVRSIFNRRKELTNHPKIATAILIGILIFGFLVVYGCPDFSFGFDDIRSMGNRFGSYVRSMDNDTKFMVGLGSFIFAVFCSLYALFYIIDRIYNIR